MTGPRMTHRSSTQTVKGPLKTVLPVRKKMETEIHSCTDKTHFFMVLYGNGCQPFPRGEPPQSLIEVLYRGSMNWELQKVVKGRSLTSLLE